MILTTRVPRYDPCPSGWPQVFGDQRQLLDRAALAQPDVKSNEFLPIRHFAPAVVAGQDEANRRGLTGSPTFLVDGNRPFAELARPSRLACPALPASERGRRRLAEPSDLRQALKRAAEAGAAGTSGCSANWRDAAGPGMAAPRRFRRDGENPPSTKGTASPVGVPGAACCIATTRRTRVIRAGQGTVGITCGTTDPFGVG